MGTCLYRDITGTHQTCRVNERTYTVCIMPGNPPDRCYLFHKANAEGMARECATRTERMREAQVTLNEARQALTKTRQMVEDLASRAERAERSEAEMRAVFNDEVGKLRVEQEALAKIVEEHRQAVGRLGYCWVVCRYQEYAGVQVLGVYSTRAAAERRRFGEIDASVVSSPVTGGAQRTGWEIVVESADPNEDGWWSRRYATRNGEVIEDPQLVEVRVIDKDGVEHRLLDRSAREGAEAAE